MPQLIGQLSYSVMNPTADPGTVADLRFASIDSFPSADPNGIQPGIFVELAADNLSVQAPQQTVAVFNPLGVALIKRGREGSGAVGVTGYGVGGVNFQQNEILPVMMLGRVYALWDSTSTQQAFARPNVMHSSTIATNRGTVTFQATSTTAGTEITQAPAAVKTRQVLPSTGNIILIDFNLPGA